MAFKKLVSIFVTTILIFAASGCGDDGPSEKAGKKLDEAADSLNKKLKKMTE